MEKIILSLILLGITFGMKAQVTELPNGNVGIGTTNPNYKLSVAGGTFNVEKNGDYYGFWVENKLRTDNPKMNLGSWYNARGGISFHYPGYYMTFDTQRGATVYSNTLVLKDGNVGIGTTSPTDKLTVSGNVNVGANGNGAIKVRHINGKDYNSSDFDNLYLNYGTGTNVIIGKNTKDSNLLVYGNIATFGKIESTEIKVTNTPTADFVFEKDYNLPTLKSIEKHIKEKKHLPEIASAKEMGENGVNIGDFQIQLLQKIEELTLYTIEQEKKIEELNSIKFKVLKLEKENKVLKNINLNVIELQRRLERLEKK